MTGPGVHEFDAKLTTELLSELDQRLRVRGVAAAVFVVGGAAIAATGIRAGRLTQDVDALTRDPAVLEEASAIAVERGLTPHWLNATAAMWMPPLPTGVLDPPSEPGLRVTYADEGFLFATKLVAQRAKDAQDLRDLAARLGMATATGADLEQHIRSYYTDRDMLEFILRGNDIDTELTLLADDASRMLQRTHRSLPPDPPRAVPRNEPPSLGF
ncbi:hypothetical protein [Nocardioides soli]|uniref:Nucleotidyl transferase AbiEii/AbiGii toxin family protein n=1 Tax=Nocardioides soli TaxID=1036020 RepID=A0A7W4VXW3_9ACTN|nr:hypothetical protein [Nocardioides soli]MBB3043695.1 hypothetical protein [Nocardioides soli]